jgi:hypothetical protein
MSLSSLPTFPDSQPGAPPMDSKKNRPTISSRWVAVLFYLAIFGSLIIASCYFWQLVDSLENPEMPSLRLPLDFELVRQRYHQIRYFLTQGEVEQLLGPPSPANGDWQGDFVEWSEKAEHAHRHLRIPADRH